MSSRRRSLILPLTLALGACSLGNPEAPLPTGPSTVALNVTLRLERDIISYDGADSTLVIATVLDPNGAPVVGQSLRFQILVEGNEVDFGQLSSKAATTNAAGVATVRYTAPGFPPQTLTSDPIIQIGVVPVGLDYQNSVQVRTVSLRLARPGVILPPAPPNGTPTASFTFSPSQPRAGDEVLFNAQESRDDDGTIVEYRWNFGDGDVVTTAAPTVEHVFDEEGGFTVSLVVVDNSGAMSLVASNSVGVGAAQTPTAAFSVSPANPRSGDLVTFDASGSRAPEGRTIVSYRWNFGDGSPEDTTSGRVARHTYVVAGNARTFTVTLTITDSAGRTSTTTQTVPVNP
jgi:PKD repeat protein